MRLSDVTELSGAGPVVEGAFLVSIFVVVGVATVFVGAVAAAGFAGGLGFLTVVSDVDVVGAVGVDLGVFVEVFPCRQISIEAISRGRDWMTLDVRRARSILSIIMMICSGEVSEVSVSNCSRSLEVTPSSAAAFSD